MQENMQRLKELQGIDQELKMIRGSRQKFEVEREALEADQERVQSMVDSLNAEIEKIEAGRQELAQSLIQEQDNVEKAESRLPTIKTQKEYVAVLKEVDTAKKMNKDLQERIQTTDSEIGALNQDKEEKVAELASQQEKVAARNSEIAADLGEFDQVITEKTEQREKLLKGLPAPMRKRYNTLLERRQGLAVVEARRGTCTGCNMHLPPQLYNSLFMVEEIQSCPHCHRLLYVVGE